MKYHHLILLSTLFLFVRQSNIFAQDATTAPIPNISLAFSQQVSKKAAQLTVRLDKKTEKALYKYQKIEAHIIAKLSKVDSIAARNFIIVSRQRYSDLKNKVLHPGRLSRYLPSLDTLTTSLSFLNQFSKLGDQSKRAQAGLEQLKGLASKLESGEDIKQYLKEQRQYIKDQLGKFGLDKELLRINKDAYYYSEELSDIKSSLGDEDKIVKKTIAILRRTRPFQQFMQKNGMLAGLFAAAGQGSSINNSSTGASIVGLQTRAQFAQLIQGQVSAGGPNAQQIIRTNFQQAEGLVNQLSNSLHELGSRGSNDIMPEGFVPNSERAKTFFNRLELNTNIQTQRANGYFPVSSDFALGVGYKLSAKGIVGIGASYKVGWGDNIQHIAISHQGIGLRSYLDWKIPSTFSGHGEGAGTWWISGGYEQNYRAEIKRIEQLKNRSAWQSSGLIGLSKKFLINSKFMKGTKMQVLWDFLSYQQIPRVNPIVFRIGYNLK